MVVREDASLVGYLHPSFFVNDAATTDIYTLSLHDALPIWPLGMGKAFGGVFHLLHERLMRFTPGEERRSTDAELIRSEEHTSELQSQSNLVCRLLLEKKKTPFAVRAQMRSTAISTELAVLF